MTASLLCKPDNKYPCGLGNRVLEDRKAEAIEQGRPWMKRQENRLKSPLRSTGETQASPQVMFPLGRTTWAVRTLTAGAARQALTALVCGDSCAVFSQCQV